MDRNFWSCHRLGTRTLDVGVGRRGRQVELGPEILEVRGLVVAVASLSSTRGRPMLLNLAFVLRPTCKDSIQKSSLEPWHLLNCATNLTRPRHLSMAKNAKKNYGLLNGIDSSENLPPKKLLDAIG